ncbi:hypothetical protein HZB07_04925 [Candidatus Saganbacteria bacterium]|nr:hypothetical protein [Candidatus Saganbacteria bacterium]
MKLADKIRNRKIAYWFRREPAIAFELALLYCIMARRQEAWEKMGEACFASRQWLAEAGVSLPAFIEKLDCYGQRYEIEKLLVINGDKIILTTLRQSWYNRNC